MTRIKTALRALRWAGLILLAAFLCAALAIPLQQQLFRWRAEHLLADMQAIRLRQTPWVDAQALMRRWGQWGHYDGECTAINCKYTITLTDLGNAVLRPGDDGIQSVIRYLVLSPAYRWLGGRLGVFEAGFIVQDGTIWRTFEDIDVDVPPRTLQPDDDGYGLIARAQSRSSLNRESSPNAHWILGGSEPSAEHPEYKAGRPGGCEICMSVEVTYSTETPSTEILQLTGFDLSCLTRRHPCTRVEDLLPAAKPWHLYVLDGDPSLREPPLGPPAPCKVPVWALGRDAVAILTVDALSSSTKNGPYPDTSVEEDKVRLTGLLKGSAPWPAGTVLTARPYAGDLVNPPFDLPEHFFPGRNYLALVIYPFPELEHENHPPPHPTAVRPGFVLDRCGILEDTPSNRLELQRGMAQNDKLRVPEF